jgi:hypothetical protein
MHTVRPSIHYIFLLNHTFCRKDFAGEGAFGIQQETAYFSLLFIRYPNHLLGQQESRTGSSYKSNITVSSNVLAFAMHTFFFLSFFPFLLLAQGESICCSKRSDHTLFAMPTYSTVHTVMIKFLKTTVNSTLKRTLIEFETGQPARIKSLDAEVNLGPSGHWAGAGDGHGKSWSWIVLTCKDHGRADSVWWSGVGLLVGNGHYRQVL